jgi:hypothetical protein
MEKKCTKCGEIKMLAEFVKHKRYKDGHYSQCKVCTKQLVKQWEKENPDKKNEIRTRYRVNNREKIREMDREYYIDNHERYLEKARIAQAKYFRTEKGREKYKLQGEAVRSRFPEKMKARRFMRTAIGNGTLLKPSKCSLCESEEFQIDAHHPDYSKPLEVVWVCKPCHGIVHRKIKSHRDRLSEKTAKADAIVKTCEETAREVSEEGFPPSKDGQ